MKILEFLIQGGIGFFAKTFLDYFYLKSPRLKPNIKVRGTGAGPPSKGYRLYSFVITIDVYNNSKNDAYDFELIEFRPTEVFKIMTNPIIVNKVPITDQKSLSIVIECQAILKEKDGFVYQDAQERVSEIDKNFHIKYSYNNALGKTYIKNLNGEMTNENFIASFVG